MQWDAPFGWAPTHWLAVSGLARYGYTMEAQRIAHEFTSTVASNYARDGTIREKYNVVSSEADVAVATGYKSNVIGFGWTNAGSTSRCSKLLSTQQNSCILLRNNAHRTSLPARAVEAFSDGVIAVIITIMLLELKVPAREVSNLAGLHDVLPLVLVYLLSFVVVGIYWVNHHYLIDGLKQVTHGILWSNLAVLFCLSRSSPSPPTGLACAASRRSPSRSIARPAPSPGVPWITLSSLICSRTGQPPAGWHVQTVCLVSRSISELYPLAWVSIPYISLGMIGLVAVVWAAPTP